MFSNQWCHSLVVMVVCYVKLELAVTRVRCGKQMIDLFLCVIGSQGWHFGSWFNDAFVLGRTQIQHSSSHFFMVGWHHQLRVNAPEPWVQLMQGELGLGTPAPEPSWKGVFLKRSLAQRGWHLPNPTIRKSKHLIDDGWLVSPLIM